MIRYRLARGLLVGAASGALVGALVATVEVVLVTITARAAVFRPELLAYGGLIYGGFGLGVGSVVGVAWGALAARRARNSLPRVRSATDSDPPAHIKASHRPSATATRRMALRIGIGVAAVAGLGSIARVLSDLASERPGKSDRLLAAATTQTATEMQSGPTTVMTVPTRSSSAAPTRTARTLNSRPPNILLVTIDTVRADQLGIYGHPFIQTPSLDRLAAQGARYDMHVVQQPQTNPSHASMFLGMYPPSSGVRVHMVDKIPANLDTLAGLLNGAGYATAGLYSWLSFDPQYSQFQRGFQTYRNVAPNAPEALDSTAAREAAANYRVAEEYLALPKIVNQASGVQARVEETAKGRADLTTDAAIAQLRSFGNQPFFLWVHYFDPHYPYQPPEALSNQYDGNYSGPVDSSMHTVDEIDSGKFVPSAADLKRLMSLYQAEISFTDLHLGRLVAAIDQLSLTDSTVVAVTSDHGEAFGEHTQEIVGGEFFHPHSLYNTEQRTPLILRYPSQIRGGTVVTAPTQAIDLFPTLLEVAGLSVPGQSQGKSLIGLVDGSDDARSRVAYSSMADYSFTSVTVPGWKFIQNNGSGHYQLFNLSQDLGELHDISASEAEVTRRLAAQTQAWMKAVGI